MKKYPPQAIDAFTRHCLKDTNGFNWLMNHGYRELIATLDAVRDDKKAFQYLMDNKHFELAAFVNAIWEDVKAFQFLMDVKAFDWAAAANIINGDDKAEQALKLAGKNHFVLLAHAIQSRIHEDGDRNMSPMGVMKNVFNFKKAFKKE
jgi:nicotinic acid phosphoribosyltransferase